MDSESNGSFENLASAFQRQFDVELKADDEVHESGMMYVNHKTDTMVRSTESVRANWLKRNAGRFGFNFESPNKLVPSSNVASEGPPWDNDHTTDDEAGDSGQSANDYDPKHSSEV